MKLIASDFDGTIRNSGAGMDEDVQAIKRWREAGNLFGLISGRNFPALSSIEEYYKIPCDFLLADSGNTCMYRGDFLFTVKCSGDIIPALGQYILAGGGSYLVINMQDRIMVLYQRPGDSIRGIKVPENEWNEIGFFTQISSVHDTSIQAKQMTDNINHEFGKYVTAFQNGRCIDTVAAGRSKATGIGDLASHLRIAHNDIFCVGDNYNDLTMIDAYRSCVVSGAKDEIKAHATLSVVDSVKDMIDLLLHI